MLNPHTLGPMPAPPLVVLWDIDGTLLRSPGIGVRAFVGAVERATGVVWTPERLDFGGRTDPDIAERILQSAGLDDPALVPAVLAALADVYSDLDADFRDAIIVLPGVAAFLGTLARCGALQTVVTGNIAPAAAAKISAAGLEASLRLEWGAFGSDHHERSELVRLGMERVAAAGHDVVVDSVWVVGDTPRDLAAARANSVRCALVATGTYGYDELGELDADVVVADLGDPRALLDAMTYAPDQR